jgi:hypothetical protein
MLAVNLSSSPERAVAACESRGDRPARQVDSKWTAGIPAIQRRCDLTAICFEYVVAADNSGARESGRLSRLGCVTCGSGFATTQASN